MRFDPFRTLQWKRAIKPLVRPQRVLIRGSGEPHLVDDILEEDREGKCGVLQLVQTAVDQRLVLWKHRSRENSKIQFNNRRRA